MSRYNGGEEEGEMRIRSLLLGIVLALSPFALPRSAYACPS